MKRSQLSLEFTIVFAASVSFLAALLPVYVQAQAAAENAIALEIQKHAFGKIVSLAKQSQALGKESFFTSHVSFAKSTFLEFDEEGLELRMSFESSGGTVVLTERTGFVVRLNQTRFEKGRHEIDVENDGEVKIYFTR